MATTKEMIRDWLLEAKKDSSVTHVLIVCDTFDYDDYPKRITKSEDINEVVKGYPRNMQKIMEVYKMSIDIEKQLSQHRAWNI